MHIHMHIHTHKARTFLIHYNIDLLVLARKEGKEAIDAPLLFLPKDVSRFAGSVAKVLLVVKRRKCNIHSFSFANALVMLKCCHCW